MTARRALTDAVGLGLLASAAFIAVVLVQPGHWRLALDAYLLCLGGLALLAITRATQAVTAPDEPPELEEAFRAARSRRSGKDAAAQLPSLARLEREVTLATTNAFDLHVRLRPALREIAEHRLYDRHGVTLDAEPERARAALGDAVWDLVRADRPPPRDRHAPGMPYPELRALVETLETL